MNYRELLNSYVESSGLTQEEIAKQCETAGFPVAQSYISRLRRGKVPPASEEVNRMISQVCKADPGPLILAAYNERAPEHIRRLIEELSQLTEMVIRVTENPPKVVVDSSIPVKLSTDLIAIAKSIDRLSEGMGHCYYALVFGFGKPDDQGA